MSGSGWDCDVPTATCTRSDALAAGDSYPDITVEVAVDGNAGSPVTNVANVSGGGDIDLSNNSDSDPTVVDPQQFALTVTVDGTGTGEVDADLGAISDCTDSGGTCDDDYDNGTVVTLTATPGLHSNFTGWGGACTGTASTCEVTMDQVRAVTATFDLFQPELRARQEPHRQLHPGRQRHVHDRGLEHRARSHLRDRHRGRQPALRSDGHGHERHRLGLRRADRDLHALGRACVRGELPRHHRHASRSTTTPPRASRTRPRSRAAVTSTCRTTTTTIRRRSTRSSSH